QKLAALTANLKPIGEVVSTLPSAQASDESSIAFDLLVACKRPLPELEQVLLAYGATPALLSASAQKPAQPSAPRIPLVPAPDVSLRSLSQTVRVDIGRLDRLMSSVGDLLLTRSNIMRFAEAARGQTAQLPKMWAQEMMREARLLERKLDELQKGIL